MMKTDFRSRVAAMSQTVFACAAMIVFASGCGGSSVPEEYSGPPSVSGTVTMDQVALSAVTVSFENSEGGPFQVVTDGAGNYAFESGEATPPLGKYLVRITGPADVDSAGDDSEEPAVPARYNSETELIVDVLAGENSIVFPLLSASEDEEEE
jgi:hypothetical protein